MTALQVIYNQPYANRALRLAEVRALAEAIQAPPLSLSVDGLWQAYAQLESSRVRGSGRRVTTDLVSLVRFAIEQDAELTPFAERVNARFDAWLAGQEANGRTFSAQQTRMAPDDPGPHRRQLHDREGGSGRSALQPKRRPRPRL